MACREGSKSVSGFELTIYWGWQTYNKSTNTFIITNYQCSKETGPLRRDLMCTGAGRAGGTGSPGEVIFKLEDGWMSIN